MSPIGTLKDVLRTTLYRVGALDAWHRLRNRRALTVLMFHRVLPADDPNFSHAEREFTFTLEGFRRALDFVERHYNVVSLDDLQKASISQAALPANPLLITFDDGWRDTLTYAAPELVRRHLPAVLFLASEVVELDGGRWWQDALVAALAQPGNSVRLCAAAGWADIPAGNVSQALAAHVAAMPEAQRRAWMALHIPGVLDQIAERQMVTLSDLQSSEASAFAIGGHGHTHSPLTLSPDSAAELQTSQRMLGKLNQGVRSMSFPHGAYNAELIAQARTSGFEWIFTSEPELVNATQWASPTPSLGRIHIPENTWTCRGGCIDPARLATFLFFRPVRTAGRP